MKMQIREVFRYGRPYTDLAEMRDGFRNHFFVTNDKLANNKIATLESGINPLAELKAVDGLRRPAILIRSSPHKVGSETTPWQDLFDVDNGYIRYFGDNKMPGRDPAFADGNKILIEAFNTYNSPDRRHLSVPLLFYKAVSKNGKSKGFIEFNGFGIITGVELITQYDRKLDRTFSNFAFAFQVFSLAAESEEFDWLWINDRRNSTLSLSQTLRNAPKSWIDWINNGNKSLEKNRRRVSKLLTFSKSEQLPPPGGNEEKVLKGIYDYYQNRKSHFESLAAAVTAKILTDSYGKYKTGWITPSSSDGGADFYGRLDIGSGFGRAKLVVLGQAKCESLNVPTGGNHIARTVARLRRGWVGVYVTTSFFSEAVQREIIEDEYPIMLINGKLLAETVLKILNDDGFKSLSDYLDSIALDHVEQIKQRRPEELLFEV